MALYALPPAVISAGWSGSRFIEWFGVGLPTVGLGGTAEDLVEMLHMWLAYTFLAVAAGHVLAALKHQWWDDHDILGRVRGDRDDRQVARSAGKTGGLGGAGGLHHLSPLHHGWHPASLGTGEGGQRAARMGR